MAAFFIVSVNCGVHHIQLFQARQRLFPPLANTALSQPKPGLIFNSGFHPTWNPELCEACIENCPTSALTMGNENIPVVNLDLCIGCGVCSIGCPEKAIDLVEREEILIPPVDQKALSEGVEEADCNFREVCE